MNSLKDKLLRAGLVTEEAAERAESEKRAEARRRREAKQNGGARRKDRGGGRPKGSAPRPAEERLSPAELAAAEAKRAEKERKKALDLEREENRRRAAEERARAEDVRRVAEHLGVDVAGEEAFHFTNRKNKLQRMRLTADAIARLEAGELAVIEHPLPHAIEFAVVPREGAEAVLKIEPRAVRFYNRGEGERYGFAD